MKTFKFIQLFILSIFSNSTYTEFEATLQSFGYSYNISVVESKYIHLLKHYT